jgi:hypothetical protein
MGPSLVRPSADRSVCLPLKMKATATVANRHTRARDAARRQIAQIGPFVEGSLSAFQRPGCVQPGWHLTFKQKGRTRTVYVPRDLASQVKLWTRNYRHLKKLIRQITRHSLALIHGHVANRQAAKHYRALMGR